MEAEKTFYRVVQTSVLLISYSLEHCNKKLYRKKMRDIDCLERVLLCC